MTHLIEMQLMVASMACAKVLAFSSFPVPPISLGKNDQIDSRTQVHAWSFLVSATDNLRSLNWYDDVGNPCRRKELYNDEPFEFIFAIGQDWPNNVDVLVDAAPTLSLASRGRSFLSKTTKFACLVLGRPPSVSKIRREDNLPIHYWKESRLLTVRVKVTTTQANQTR
jgi:hypothetical protein